MIHWLLPLKELDCDSIRASRLASVRLRAGAFAAACSSRGSRVYFGEDLKNQAEILVVGKIGGDLNSQRVMHWRQVIALAKDRGAKIVVDYTDHHLIASHSMGDFYRSLLDLADSFVVPSEGMRGNLMTIWNGKITVIPDAIEVGIQSPRSLFGPSPSLLWFGHNSNLSYLAEWTGTISQSAPPAKLNLVTDSFGIERLMHSGVPMPKSWNAEVFPWSLGNLLAVARVCNLCVIPSDPLDQKKNGAGSNRLLTALALGLPVAADLLPAYREFGKFFTDIRSINWSQTLHQAVFDSRVVLNAQQEVLPNYLLPSIGQKWINFFNELSENCLPV